MNFLDTNTIKNDKLLKYRCEYYADFNCHNSKNDTSQYKYDY